MRVDLIRAAREQIVGKEILFFDTVLSTNTVALALADTHGEGTVVVADCQEKGRGKRGRSWVSPPGVNIYLSIILRPAIAPERVNLLTMMSAVACSRAVHEATGLDVALKWPNDLMVSGKKLGGILTETKITPHTVLVAVVGIGINVNMDAGDFPEHIRSTATSIRLETGTLFQREGIIEKILDEMDHWYRSLQSGDSQRVIDEWRSRNDTLGRMIHVRHGSMTAMGVAEAVDDRGLLLVRLSSGDLLPVSTGDITVLN